MKNNPYGNNREAGPGEIEASGALLPSLGQGELQSSSVCILGSVPERMGCPTLRSP